MCEAKAFVKQNDKLELLMEDVVSVTPEGSKLVLKDILGQSKTIEAKIVEIGLLDHQIILQADTSHPA